MSYRAVSLFAGSGGLDLGFIAAGFEIVFANDIDPVASATYRQNIGDIETCPIEECDLPELGNVDVVIGGPSCQGYSVAGKMDPNDPRSQHVFRFMEVVEHYMPRMFVMENVKALAVNKRWGGVREDLLNKAKSLGYNTRLEVLNAADFGVPQARERMFFVGVLGHDNAILPVKNPCVPRVSVREALSKLPTYMTAGNNEICTARITPAKNPVLRRSPFAGMLFNGQGRPLNLDEPSLTLPASMGGNRTPIIDQEWLDDRGKNPWVVGYHRRLMGGGNTVKSVPSRLRRLTVVEAAALQSFPSDFVFSGKQSAQYRQIGNAVPPLLAEHAATSVSATLNAL